MAVVRVCREHGLVLEESLDDDKLTCPAGHVVKRWTVVDTIKRVAVGEASVSEEEEMRGMRAKVAVRRAPTPESEARGDVKVKVQRAANFSSEKGARLQVRLIHAKKVGRFRVGWARIEASGSKTAGWSADAIDFERGVAAFLSAIKKALTMGWQQAAVGRTLKIADIPKP